MGRKKIQIRKIGDPKTKSVTFTRRRNGLLKKAYEISVLCDTRVVILMFDQKDACHVYSTINEENSAVDMMNMYINKSFITTDPRRNFEIPSNLTPELNGGLRTCPNKNPIAIVNTYEVVPAPLDGEQQIDDCDLDGSEQLRVLSNRLYHSVSVGLPGINLITPALTHDGDTFSPRLSSTGFPTPELNNMAADDPAGLGILSENLMSNFNAPRPRSTSPRMHSPQMMGQSQRTWKKPVVMQPNAMRQSLSARSDHFHQAQPLAQAVDRSAKFGTSLGQNVRSPLVQDHRISATEDPNVDRSMMDVNFDSYSIGNRPYITAAMDVSNPAVYSTDFFDEPLSSDFHLQQVAGQRRLAGDRVTIEEPCYEYSHYGNIFTNDTAQGMGENWLVESPDTNHSVVDQGMAWM